MRVSVVARNMGTDVSRLQPWRYLGEMACGLVRLGHRVELFSDVPISERPHRQGIVQKDVSSVGTWWPFPFRSPPQDLVSLLNAGHPDVMLWHVGTTSIGHTRPRRGVGARHVAILTSPLYSFGDLRRVGIGMLGASRDYAIHVAGASIPDRFLASYLTRHFDLTVVLVPSTRNRLVAAGMPPHLLTVIPPGRDEDMTPQPPAGGEQDGIRFLYAGSALSIRGADLLVRAFADAHPALPAARLLLLCRHERSDFAARERSLLALAARLGIENWVEVFSGTLSRGSFLELMSTSDAVVLPFRLVPSEAPLAVIEAAALGKPLIASMVAGIPDLAAPGSVLVPAGDRRSLTLALVRVGTDSDARASMARQARQWAEHYPTWPDVVMMMDRKLEQLGAMTLEHVR